MDRIPIIVENDQNNVIGSVIFTQDFENALLKGLKNNISFKIGGGINLSKDKIMYLSISLDSKNDSERR
jgi:hypothetical protein